MEQEENPAIGKENRTEDETEQEENLASHNKNWTENETEQEENFAFRKGIWTENETILMLWDMRSPQLRRDLQEISRHFGALFKELLILRARMRTERILEAREELIKAFLKRNEDLENTSLEHDDPGLSLMFMLAVAECGQSFLTSRGHEHEAAIELISRFSRWLLMNHASEICYAFHRLGLERRSFHNTVRLRACRTFACLTVLVVALVLLVLRSQISVST